MTMGMVKKDLSWDNLQFSEVFHHLQNLQLHLFDQ